ncbi:DNA alkylation repair protein [Candidatus Pacearchaeota archaeon]|nr:DNA alkylation repair protein [Candidatus Pacearchaeota archaeon]|tara:strand:+ start:900 stop:1601 length:702 start_codon:yes stop_codon:yes gene_type:complete
MTLKQLKASVLSLKNPEKIPIYQNFFKTGKGEYGEGDIFYGLTVPQSRTIVKKYSSLPLKDVESLLESEIHEERLIAILLLVHNYEHFPNKRKEIYNFYLNNTKKINNWDLVDLSAHKIVGKHIENKDRKIIYKLAKSDNLWEKRISIIATAYFISKSDFKDTIKISELLLSDSHDLIHKAVGWMLREVGKKDISILEAFLKKHYKTMPRTMLRYSIEKFPEPVRKRYLKGEI